MTTTTLLIIILVVLLVGGGGFYGRGRWYWTYPQRHCALLSAALLPQHPPYRKPVSDEAEQSEAIESLRLKLALEAAECSLRRQAIIVKPITSAISPNTESHCWHINCSTSCWTITHTNAAISNSSKHR
jgi:hypothetical protein